MRGLRQIGALVAVLGALAGTTTANASTGHLDRVFGSGGIRYLPPSFGETFGAALFPGGRILLGGRERLIALLPSGRVDRDFGTAGSAPIVGPGPEPVETSDVAVDLQGRPVVIASDSFREPTPEEALADFGLRSIVERFTTQGRLDPGFGDGNGYVVNDFGLPPAALGELPYVIADQSALDADGGIFLSGTYKIGTIPAKFGSNLVNAAFLAHLDASGQWSRSFGSRGVLRWTRPSNIGVPAVGQEGSVVVPASHGRSSELNSVIRLGANGKADTQFGTGGHARYPGGTSGSPVFIDAKGRIVVFGRLRGVEHRLPVGFLIRRLRADGSLDRRFGDGGAVTVRLPRSSKAELGLDKRGRILVVISLKGRGPVGEPQDMALLRLQTNGNVDKSFGHEGVVAIPFAGTRPVYLEGFDVRGDKALISATFCGRAPCRPVLALVDLGRG